MADSTVPGGLDSRGWDDDGTPSGRFDLVREGRLVGVQSGRASAGARGSARRPLVPGGGLVRASYRSDHERLPAPGQGSLDDLLADTEDGAIYADMQEVLVHRPVRGGTSSSPARSRGRSGCRARLLRLPTHQGSSVPFWRSCDAVTGESEWELHGIVNCGKGNPMQIAEMSHGARTGAIPGRSGCWCETRELRCSRYESPQGPCVLDGPALGLSAHTERAACCRRGPTRCRSTAALVQEIGVVVRARDVCASFPDTGRIVGVNRPGIRLDF